MNQSTEAFHYDCLDEPRSDMLRHGDGTGRDVQNAACDVNTYHGGLRCCKHHFFLTDKEQESQIPAAVDKYFHHWVFLIDAQVNDYEEDNAEYGKESIGKIT